MFINFKKIFSVLLVLVIGVGIGVGTTKLIQRYQEPKQTVSVVGTGEVDATTDQANITIQIKTVSTTYEKAQLENKTDVDNLKSELTKLGIPESRITVSSYSQPILSGLEPEFNTIEYPELKMMPRPPVNNSPTVTTDLNLVINPIKNIEKIFDLVAIRIIVPTISDCYKVLGLIHSVWKPLPGRIKDYIAQPKPNDYQSLHTTVVTPGGKIAEFQIRTNEMHIQSEFGIASHWHYKENGMGIFSRISGFHPKGYNPPKKLKWIQDLAEWQKNVLDNTQYVNALKTDALKDRIFIFTPQGDVIELPEDSTPIDFAYHIHTDIGHKCVAAKINGLMESLDTTLKNGDMIEIITDKNRKAPNLDWLNFVKTNTARSKIRSFFQKRG